MKYRKNYLEKINLYVMLVFIPLFVLILGTFNYIKTYQKNDLSNTNSVKIQQIGSTMDEIVRLIEYGMINNSVISSSGFEEKYDFSDSFTTTIFKNINTVMNTYNIFDSIFYLDGNNQKAIISGFGICDISKCGNVILDSINTNSDVQYTSLWVTPNNRKVISLIVKDGLDRYSARMVVYNIDIKKLFNVYIERVYKNEEYNEYFLYNSKGELLIGSSDYGKDSKYKVYNEEMFQTNKNNIINKYKMHNDWIIISKIKTNLLYNYINVFFMRLFILFIVIGVLTLILLYFISRKIYKPINRWYQKFHFLNAYRDNDIETIEYSIDKVTNDNKLLNEKMNFFSSSIKELYIYNKIFNHHKENDATVTLSPVKVLVVFFEVESANMLTVKNLFEKIRDENIDNSNTQILFEGRNSCECIIYFDADDKKSMDRLIENIMAACKGKNQEGKLFFDYENFESIEDANVIYEKCLKRTLNKYYEHIFTLNFNNGISSYNIMLNICRSDHKELLKYLEKLYFNNTMTVKEESIVIINFFFVVFRLYEECKIKINDGFYYMFMNCFSHSKSYTDISLIFKILLEKLNGMECNTNNSFTNEETNNKYIKEMYRFIEKNYNRNIGLLEIADHLNITKQYLCTIIKKQFDLTLHDILNKYRVEKAIELLNKDYKINDIANMVGFSNATYFSSVFKKVMGVQPSEYRRNISLLDSHEQSN